MSTQPVYSDLTSLAHAAESIEAVRSDDYSEFELLQPGKVVSMRRTIKTATTPEELRKTGIIKVRLTFDEGFVNAEGSPLGGRGQSLTLSSKVFVTPGKGATSQIANYLAGAGFDSKGLRGADLLQFVEESADIPTGFFIDWENRTERDDTTGEYPKPVLKTKDFNVGTKEEPSFAPTVDVGGVKYEARYKVSGLKFWTVK